MTREQFKHWKQNGNLKFKSQEIYDSLSNDLSENVPISPRNMAELAKYLQLCLTEEYNAHQSTKSKVLSFAIELNKYNKE